jgi:hypothetical protein
MTTPVGWIDDEIRVDSVLTTSGRGYEHRYRLVGGPDDGREFESLSALAEYVGALSSATIRWTKPRE